MRIRPVTRKVLLKIEQLSRTIKGKRRLEDISLEIRAGDRIGLIGPTGSGKSLLLRSLAMLEPIDSGNLLWHQSPVPNDRVTMFRSQAIYVHQRAGRFEGTVRSVLQAPFQLRVHRHLRYDADWIAAQLATVGLDVSFLDQPHEQLSGGETQIVALLRAIQLSPQLLLLDEPTSALDSQSALQIESLVMRWFEDAQDARAFVWVSHDERQSQRICGSWLLMKHGRLESFPGLA